MGRRALWLRWVALVSLGELAGFVVPGVTGVRTAELSSAAQLASLPVAGLFEGALLGLAQALVLRRHLPGFRPAAWVVATSLGAAVAWFLGMLPSTTYDVWSTWATPWVVVAAALVGTALLCTIGVAQALVMPRGTAHVATWVGWTAAGWCAGLAAFGLVAPPLWHEGQSVTYGVLVGLAGATAMAVAMASVTGLGVLRFVARAVSVPRPAGDRGERLLTTLIGTPVYDESGVRIGSTHDLVIDLARDLDRVPVTRLLVRVTHGPLAAADWEQVARRRHDDALVVHRQPVPFTDSALLPTEVLVRRDVLDCPVITAVPPRRTRVNDVVLELVGSGAWVTGVDLSPNGAVRRLVGRPSGSLGLTAEPLSRVHLLSRRGHSAQLAVPEAMVWRLQADGMAEVLTRAPVGHARDIMRAAEQTVREDAVQLLHPHVRARVTGSDSPPRRTRRFRGWRLHRPGPGNRSVDHR